VNINSKVFDMIEAVADESRVDISEHDILPEILKGSAPVEEKDKRLSYGQVKAKKSFDTFIKRLLSQRRWFGEDLSESQISKLKEFWEAGGKPIIEIKERGTKGGSGDVNRPFFIDLPVKHWREPDKHVDKMAIYEHDLLDDFQAEIAHSIKYAKQEGESAFEWIARRGELNRAHAREKEDFGERTYGYDLPAGLGREIQHGISTKDRKFFPTMKEKYFEISTKDGEEIIVDKEGNIYPDMEVPQNGTGRTLAWGVSTPETVEFDPKTRLGVGGQVLTQEFDAHSVVQDSLWNVLNEEGFFDVLEEALPE